MFARVRALTRQKTELEQQLKEALSKEHWGVANTILQQIALASEDEEDRQLILNATWQVLEEKDKNWRRVYKGMCLIEVLLKRGSTAIIGDIKRDLWRIQKWREHRINEGGKEVAGGIREKANVIADLCEDTKRLNQERDKNYEMYEKMKGIGMRSQHDSFDSWRKEAFGSGGGGSAPSSNRRQNDVAEFCASTGASVAVAEEMLSRHSGNLALAIEEHLKGGSSRGKKPGFLEQRRLCEQVQAILDIPERKAMELLDSVGWDAEAAIAQGQDGGRGRNNYRKGRSMDGRARSGSASRRHSNQFDSDSDSEPDNFTAMAQRSRSQPDGIGQSNGGFSGWPSSHGGRAGSFDGRAGSFDGRAGGFDGRAGSFDGRAGGFDGSGWGAPPTNSSPWGSGGGGFGSRTSRDGHQSVPASMGGFGASGFGGMDANSRGYGGGCGSLSFGDSPGGCGRQQGFGDPFGSGMGAGSSHGFGSSHALNPFGGGGAACGGKGANGKGCGGLGYNTGGFDNKGSLGGFDNKGSPFGGKGVFDKGAFGKGGNSMSGFGQSPGAGSGGFGSGFGSQPSGFSGAQYGGPGGNQAQGNHQMGSDPFGSPFGNKGGYPGKGGPHGSFGQGRAQAGGFGGQGDSFGQSGGFSVSPPTPSFGRHDNSFLNQQSSPPAGNFGAFSTPSGNRFGGPGGDVGFGSQGGNQGFGASGPFGPPPTSMQSGKGNFGGAGNPFGNQGGQGFGSHQGFGGQGGGFNGSPGGGFGGPGRGFGGQGVW